MADPNKNPSAVVTSGQGPWQHNEEIQIVGNRVTNRSADFLYQWGEFVPLPSGPIGLINDSALTVCVSALVTSMSKLLFVIGLPFVSAAIVLCWVAVIFSMCFAVSKRHSTLGFHFYLRFAFVAFGTIIGGGMV